MSEIRRCGAADIGAVMRFIDAHWSRGHVLSRDRRLMDWQYADTDDDGGAYNWWLAEDGDGLQGVLGFIPTWRYDPQLKAAPVIWLALWKVRDEPANRGLGLKLLGALARWCPGAVIAVQGINAQHPPMYRALGFQVGALTQYLVCHPELPQTVLGVPPGFIRPVPQRGRAVWRRTTPEALAALPLPVAAMPGKTAGYFARRFFAHPVYTYGVFEVELDGRLAGVVATRVAVAGASSVLRIVDYAGDEGALSESGAAIAEQLVGGGCEYADFWQYGLSRPAVERAGFRAVDPAGDLIVPNYFEPFLRRNGRIEFAVKGAGDAPIRLCRADGDQDRPNAIPQHPEA